MKKGVTILSLITFAFSSMLVVSCKRTESNKGTNYINNVSNDKHYSSNSREKDSKENNKNSGLNNTIIEKHLPNKNDVQSDHPIQRNNNSDVLSEEKERVLELLKDLSNKTEITKFAEELITKKEYLLGKQIQDKEWFEYSKKIENLFKERKYEKIKEELINLLEEIKGLTSDKKSIEDKLKTYKGWTVDEQLKEGLLLEFKFFFDSKFYITQEKKTQEAIKSFLEEINKLISEKNTNELKEKLFKLVDEISQLEKD
ncbi:hypothetical protein [Mycoplasma feriruminatoris]|uniref:hypothetical protein n=1 Tax=Mycoplasma feriruminatoris TaxID=1179777 RepID=UPI0002A4EC80|nr:hypothetical protein [Mycoplasma feriruminatoris]UKS54169.1 hypothetical protein D500_00522 [Mycoplasma feriruminatoris]